MNEARAPFVRRVVWLAGALGGGAACVALLLCGGFAALTLTLSAAAAIVLFGTLQLQVRLLLSQLLQQRVVWRALLVVLRMATLGAVTLSAVHLGRNNFLALMVGFAVLPVALLVHGVVQAATGWRHANEQVLNRRQRAANLETGDLNGDSNDGS